MQHPSVVFYQKKHLYAWLNFYTVKEETSSLDGGVVCSDREGGNWWWSS